MLNRTQSFETDIKDDMCELLKDFWWLSSVDIYKGRVDTSIH